MKAADQDLLEMLDILTVMAKENPCRMDLKLLRCIASSIEGLFTGI